VAVAARVRVQLHAGLRADHRLDRPQDTDVQTLRTIAVNSQYLEALFAILYMTGSGIEGVVALVTAFRSTRKETITSAPPPVSVTTPGATVQTASPGPAGAHGPDPTQFGGPRP
jgi:hypothetical protein